MRTPKIRFKPFLGIITVLQLSACAELPDPTKNMMDGWLGSHKDQLLMQWGAPTNIMELSDGSEVLEYKKNWQDRVFGGVEFEEVQDRCNPTETTIGTVNQVGNGYQFNTRTETQKNCLKLLGPMKQKYRYTTETCTKRFKVNKEGILSSWSYNNC